VSLARGQLRRLGKMAGQMLHATGRSRQRSRGHIAFASKHRLLAHTNESVLKIDGLSCWLA
jgi:hypothetical protein